MRPTGRTTSLRPAKAQSWNIAITPDTSSQRADVSPSLHPERIAAVNRDGRWPAFAPSFFPELDLSGLVSIVEVEAVIEREFSSKAPTAKQIADRIAADAYMSRYELLLDCTRYLYWAHRYSLTLYNLRPCRWEDAPVGDPEARLPFTVPLDAARDTAGVVTGAFASIPPAWPGHTEQDVLDLLAEPLACVPYDAARLSPAPLCVEVAAEDPESVAMRVPRPSPLEARLHRRNVLELTDPVPELTALLRQAGAIACEHVGRWGRLELKKIRELRASDFVLLAWPRSEHVARLLDDRPGRHGPARASRPIERAVAGTAHLRYSPSRGVTIAALAAAKGEVRVTNDDLIANAAWHWSPMSSADIFERTGILERRYTDGTLDDIAAEAALQVLRQSDEAATGIGAVVACTATNMQPMPSFAARIADLAGLTRLAGVWDVTAACAGFPFGLAQAAGIVEQAGCGVLLVLADKYSDKVGTVRSSRMLFGDGAAALLLTPATDPPGDIHLVQTYAGGTSTEVHAVVWPNAAFNNSVTVDAQGARSIVDRYMRQIVNDLSTGERRSAQDMVDVIVPHQANEPMIREIALAAGIPEERLYFNVAHVGNLGAASIPIALHDAILDGTIAEESCVLAPAFAAGSLAGFARLTIRAQAAVAATPASSNVDADRGCTPPVTERRQPSLSSLSPSAAA